MKLLGIRRLPITRRKLPGVWGPRCIRRSLGLGFGLRGGVGVSVAGTLCPRDGLAGGVRALTLPGANLGWLAKEWEGMSG